MADGDRFFPGAQRRAYHRRPLFRVDSFSYRIVQNAAVCERGNNGKRDFGKNFRHHKRAWPAVCTPQHTCIAANNKTPINIASIKTPNTAAQRRKPCRVVYGAWPRGTSPPCRPAWRLSLLTTHPAGSFPSVVLVTALGPAATHLCNNNSSRKTCTTPNQQRYHRAFTIAFDST
jgi:hypothetical protein